MLINFSVYNFRSFKNEAILRMEATDLTDLPKSVINKEEYQLLPVAVMYGANSSGKSNLLKAIARMASLIIGSSKLNPNEMLNYEPFALNSTSKSLPTSFEIQFLVKDSKYRYGFEYNQYRIINEWLYQLRHHEEEDLLFLRAENEIEVSETHFKEGLGKETLTPANRLFVSVIAQLNGPISKSILRWFENLNALDGADTGIYEDITLNMFHNKTDGYTEALNFFKLLKLGFNDMVVEDKPLSQDILDSLTRAPESVRNSILKRFEKGEIVESMTKHNIYDAEGHIIGERLFSKDRMESEGTIKMIELSGPIFEALLHGTILIVDEFDAKWHPMLTANVIKLFMNPDTNKHGAQLIFATHDTNLLSSNLFRRDQIWFTEKDKTESTDLYSLIEFKNSKRSQIDNNINIEKEYINGRYGAIPYIGGKRYDQEQITAAEA